MTIASSEEHDKSVQLLLDRGCTGQPSGHCECSLVFVSRVHTMSKLFTHSGPMVVGHMYRIGFMDILFRL